PSTGPQTVKLNVERSTGITLFQTKPARIEWTAQDRIRVLDLDPTGNPAGDQVVFDAAASEITKARYAPGNPGRLTLWAGQTKVALFPDAALPSPEPWESVEQYNERIATAAVPAPLWWTERLKYYGVDAKGWTHGKIFGITLAITLAAFVLIGLLIWIVN
ncbi:hypothetical protein, partial [Ruania albidiflava]|uniref:hypothetical protein n=1 Tax=Ruania albidiflava TaxID=366586 RepID=UPI0023F4EF02